MQQRDKVTVWGGEGLVSEKDALECHAARFVAYGITTNDAAYVELIEAAAEEQPTRPRGVAVAILKVEDETTLILGDVPTWLQQVPVKVEIWRWVAQPCVVCKKTNVVRESDHYHCIRCKSEMPLSTKTAHCEKCLDYVRDKLIRANGFTEEVTLFGGRRIARVHAKTVEEGDAIQEWQDAVLKDMPHASIAYMSEASSRMALTLALDDDGFGRSPRQSLTPDGPTTGVDQLLLMSKFFRGMNDGYYKGLLMGLLHVDLLVCEACEETLAEEVKEDEILVLTERLATMSPEEEVTGTVKIFNGKETLLFACPKTDDMDGANGFAEELLQGDRDVITEARGKFLVAVSRLAAHFRGDSKVKFDAESTFSERLTYLMGIPQPLYYLYLSAAGVWQGRIAKAADVGLLGNF